MMIMNKKMMIIDQLMKHKISKIFNLVLLYYKRTLLSTLKGLYMKINLRQIDKTVIESLKQYSNINAGKFIQGLNYTKDREYGINFKTLYDVNWKYLNDIKTTDHNDNYKTYYCEFIKKYNYHNLNLYIIYIKEVDRYTTVNQKVFEEFKI